MDLSKSIKERIAERKRKGEEEAARRRGTAEGLPVSIPRFTPRELFQFKPVGRIRRMIIMKMPYTLSTAHKLEQLPRG